MRSNSLTTRGAETKGTLYVLATPIGNLQDITLRALDVLLSVDFIATEDTRHTGRLLKGRNPRGRFILYHEQNEEKRTPLLLEKLEAAYRNLANQKGVSFLSLLDVVSQTNYIDGLHPNDAGHQEIANVVQAFLNNQ